jgi:uncharacterized protein YjiS (DUF1127 family)
MTGRALERNDTIASCSRGPAERASTLGCALREACRRFWRSERTRAELSALSDPELKDMGLFRCDISRVAAENYR